MDFLDELPPQLKHQVKKIITILPKSLTTFEEVYKHGKSQGFTESNLENKRKLPKKAVTNLENNNEQSNSLTSITDQDTIFKLKDISILSPIRKKLNLYLHVSFKNKKPILSLVKDKDQVEISVFNLNKNIKLATFLPVPEKPKLVYLFISYINENNYKDDNSTNIIDKSASNIILINLNKELILQQFKDSGLIEQEVEDFSKCIEYMRKQAILTGFRIFDPFSIDNTNSTSNKQSISSFYVGAHRGTKEGSLYFLPNYVIFGFKKPILVFESDNIESISYSSITRVTFNATLITKDSEKYEFSMIDQSEFNKIDEYVKNKSVVDNSMSEELKAKSKKSNTSAEELSALKEARSKLAENGMTVDGINFDSDDDEEDEDFNNESEVGSDSESDSDNNTSEAEEEEEAEEDDNDEEQNISTSEIQKEMLFPSATGLNGSNKLENSLIFQNIPIPLDNDDDDADDDDGSGVEYD
ncbi:hypothetical protein TBLA_0G00380 [Henningerozyma blattae CBS 6284]|uniref:Histone chaperone RTT106 n=1 Tax=Henningerozyma blattae (strain ATCC 34711 / CBS 6284 / DSM 70876 / NBRC 10599 / NRRL Y-10934 / UCD 77-7) TaxID=1071380 RepID=I2H6I5_HENB6|nr:hypothetical protein TBLA_0G00380 [Tetrapisispora blattae CBS 6284]CCH61987.1 hypothetical protein TBLA_0G00380 [Tetrapisispora blattae CBS 6284]